MSKEISIVKLMDGSTVVGKIEYGTDCIEIEHPIELVSNVQPLQGMTGEQINLRPWMAISEETIFVVERMQIITIGLLDKTFENGYLRMVEQIYMKKSVWAGSLMDDQLESEIDLDTMHELADAIIKKQIH
jgi:hypothetical protein